MSILTNRKLFTILLAVFTACLIPPGLAAEDTDTLRIQAGGWAGLREPELETRFLLDDLIGTTERINLPWRGGFTVTGYPLGFAYLRKAGPGRLVLEGNYIDYSPEYSYASFDPDADSIGLIRLQEFEQTEYEGLLGYEIPLAANKLYVTPLVGARQHFKEFNYDEFTIGDDTYVKSMFSPFEASGRFTVQGLRGRFEAHPKLSLIGEYLYSSISDLGGSMYHDRFLWGVNDGNLFLTYETASAGYEVEMHHTMLGVETPVTKDLKLRVGVRNETQTVRYPGYYSLAFVVLDDRPGGDTGFVDVDTEEFITDYIFYSLPLRSTKGSVWAAISYDLNWSY